MTAITRLLQLFPHGEIKQSIIDEYNAQAESEFVRIRDFIILHYKATERDDSPFWRYCRDMDVPDELSHRMKLFKDYGKSFQVEGELFRLDSWTQVMLGQGLVPSSYHPIVELMSERDLKHFLDGVAADVNKNMAMLSSHQDFIKKYCGSI
jgi:tryptophan halogenase